MIDLTKVGSLFRPSFCRRNDTAEQQVFSIVLQAPEDYSSFSSQAKRHVKLPQKSHEHTSQLLCCRRYILQHATVTAQSLLAVYEGLL